MRYKAIRETTKLSIYVMGLHWGFLFHLVVLFVYSCHQTTVFYFCLICLVLIEFLRSIGYRVSSNLGKFWPLFLQIAFLSQLLPPNSPAPFSDFSSTYIICLLLFPWVTNILGFFFPFFLFFSGVPHFVKFLCYGQTSENCPQKTWMQTLTIYNSPKVETIQMSIIWQVHKQNRGYPYTLYSNQEYCNTIQMLNSQSQHQIPQVKSSVLHQTALTLSIRPPAFLNS